MRVKLQEALQAMMKARASSEDPLDLSSRGSKQSARNTARSAASGYDDHPTHRSMEVPRPRPPSVPAISNEEWALVQRQKEIEDEENEAWAAQEEGGGPSELEEASYDDMYDELDLEDEEVEHLMRLHYERQALGASERSDEVEPDRSDRVVGRPQSRGSFYPTRAGEEEDEGEEDEDEDEGRDAFSASDRTLDANDSLTPSMVGSDAESPANISS
uniref:Uncharacterized protein n=1 Tax=Hanusia phi TaxID=3032 RepID=A0A7S0EQ14_9CRYP